MRSARSDRPYRPDSRRVTGLIAEHFIRPGSLAQEHGRALSRVAGDRGEADYNVAAVFCEADVREDLVLAEKFLKAVEALVLRPPEP